jgi:hypothetical protein
MWFPRTRAALFVGILAALAASAIAGRGDGLYVPFSMPATSCSNQFVRSIAATGAGTCSAIAAGDFPALTGDVTTPSGSLGTTIATGAVGNAKLGNMNNSTIKCRTTAGDGVPEDCTPAQAAAIVGSVGGTLKSNTIQFTRDLTSASGDVSYTGMGFLPTMCIFSGAVGGSLTQYLTIVSVSDSAKNSIAVNLQASQIVAPGNGTNVLVFGDATGANFNNAIVKTYDADGLTLTWTKIATPTGTATIRATCMR